MWIFEVMTIDREIETMIVKWASEKEILEQARKSQWFITVLQDWLLKALAWLTTVSEVFEIASID